MNEATLLTLAEFFDRHDMGTNPCAAEAARRLGAGGFFVGIYRRGDRNIHDEYMGLCFHALTSLDLLALYGPGSYRLVSHRVMGVVIGPSEEQIFVEVAEHDSYVSRFTSL